MRKGIFWWKNSGAEGTELITVSVVCDKNGDSQEPVQFSSKSGNNFNHMILRERREVLPAVRAQRLHRISV